MESGGRSMGGERSTELEDLAAVFSLAIPALGIVAVDPLMSLVDTACLGQVSTKHLAALAPNSGVFNMIFQVFTFIGVSVTNVLASNSPHAPSITDAERRVRAVASQRMQSHGLVLAAACGLFCTFVCVAWGTTLLRAMGTSDELLPLALRYLRIRGLSAPAVMLMNAANGAFLGQQNTSTPVKVFVPAASVNAALDVLFVLGFGWGLTGAALATCVVQYATAVVFLHALHRQGSAPLGVKLVWSGLPTLADMAPFWDVGWKLLTRTLFKMAAFASITMAATTLSTNDAASHQVALQVFWLLSFFPEPLSMTAQSLIARDSTDVALVRKLAWLLMRMAGWLSVGLATLVTLGFMYGSYIFTPDEDIVENIQALVFPGITGIVVCTYVMQFDGIYIGSSDFDHLPRTNLVAFVICSAMLWYGHTHGLGLVWVWWAMAVFFLARAAQHVLHARLHYETSIFGLYSRRGSHLKADDRIAPHDGV